MSNVLFTPVPRVLKDLLADIEIGRLGLPELQRGYVWKASKVRDLLDSMREQLTKILAEECAFVNALHALPERWEHIEYDEFLRRRRVLMARVIQRGYERLGGNLRTYLGGILNEQNN